jgi:hydroxyacylglutathione hydrolase
MQVNDPTLPFEFHHIQLGNFAFEGLNNCYVVGMESDATTTLIDTGDAYPSTETALRDQLATLGLGFEDIEQVLLTHWHEDHTGLAGAIQAESGATVRVHEADASLITDETRADAAMQARLKALLAEWGLPGAASTELLDVIEDPEAAGIPSKVTPFTDGERFNIGSMVLNAVALPGHTAGLTGFSFETERGTELFSSDALLPYYTPNVGGADIRVKNALAAYLETLTGIVERGYVRAWPGHRGAIVDPGGRAADIIAHHRQRTERIVAVLRDGSATPWTVSARLFGNLSHIHILHGPGEVHAHLEHLESANVVEGSGTPREYRLVDQEPSVDTLFPDVGYAATDIVAED